MPHIDSYTFGLAKVDGHTYTSDLKLFPDKVKPNWWREEGHELHLSDIEDVIAASPKVLIIGTGASGAMKVPDEVIKNIESLDIELLVFPTKEAVEKYNLISPGKKTIACLHLTC